MPDEPTFTLRASDPLAEQAVISYAQECAKSGLIKEARESYAIARAMKAYNAISCKECK